jgi:hypothetical protein
VLDILRVLGVDTGLIDTIATDMQTFSTVTMDELLAVLMRCNVPGDVITRLRVMLAHTSSQSQSRAHPHFGVHTRRDDATLPSERAQVPPPAPPSTGV